VIGGAAPGTCCPAFAVQVVTLRYLGDFLGDPLEVPAGVLDYVAGQSASRIGRAPAAARAPVGGARPGERGGQKQPSFAVT
jgi:hypothetical protein